MLIGAIAGTAFMGALAFVGPMVLPASTAQSIAAGVLTRVLGFPVTVAGETQLTLLPTLLLEVNGINAAVRYSERGAQRAPVLFDVPKIRIEAETLPILFSRINIRTIHVERPVLRLHVDRKGRRNWRPAAPLPDRPLDPDRRVEPDHDWGLWNELKIGSITVRDGRVVLHDQLAGRRIDARNISLRSSNPVNTSGGPGFLIAGGAIVNGERMALKFETGPIRKFLSGDRLPLVMEMSGAPLTVRYQGAVAKRQFFVTEGAFRLNAGSLTKVDQWLGPLFASPVSGNLEISTKVNINGPSADFDSVVIQLDETVATGTASVSADAGGDYTLDAKFETSDLNLSPMVAVPGPVRRSRVAVSAFPLTLLPLSMRGRIQLEWRKIRFLDLAAGAGRADIALGPENRRIDAGLSMTGFYRGSASGRLQFGLSEGMNSLRLAWHARRVDVARLLTATADRVPVSGAGDFKLDLFSVGGSPTELMAALSGKGRFNVLNGKIMDPVMVEHLAGAETASIPFQQLIGSFSVRRGVARGDDLLLRADDFSLVGAGEVDLAKDMLNVNLRTVNTGAGGPQGTRSVDPFRLEGPLMNYAILTN